VTQSQTLIDRAFYTCPLNRDDPKKCKFFKWEDELGLTTPQKPNPAGAGRTLGESPGATRTPISKTPSTLTIGRGPEPEVEEIDWDKVDTDDLETQAIMSTPGSSQQASQGQTPKSTSFQDRLRAAVDDGMGKRNREDEEQTPKRAKLDPDVRSTLLRKLLLTIQNPFLNSAGLTSPRSPSHPILSPALASLDQVSEHIQRQERLIRASEQMKQGLRRTIANLQKEKDELSLENKELKRRAAERQ
jgi:hypothetical protein